MTTFPIYIYLSSYLVIDMQVIVPNGVEQFCFPDSTNWPPPLQTASDPYTIVLTDSKGDRQYGYCRRVVPEGAHTCIPITYCILTRHRSAGFYNKVGALDLNYPLRFFILFANSDAFDLPL